MELINSTPVPAKSLVGRLFENEDRFGTLIAKATFQFRGGRLELDRQDPEPLLDEDRATPLGLLPSDLVPRRDDAFEVLLLGAAYSPSEKPVTSMRVSLRVADVRRELLVTGDRKWATHPSAACPFHRMPLGPDRALGGRVLVEVDRDAFIEVADPNNPEGRGFDPAPHVHALKAALRPPPGYPRFDETRSAPNVETPGATIPAIWSAIPPTAWMHACRSVDVEATGPAIRSGALHRAHPDWVIERPRPGQPIELTGVRPHGKVLDAEVPALRVFADFVSGARDGARELEPQLLCLLPEEERAYIVYRHSFSFRYQAGEERCFRLRLEDGMR